MRFGLGVVGQVEFLARLKGACLARRACDSARVRFALLFAAAMLVAALMPAAASAATCSDHGSQADAQRVAGTREGDGVYCASLAKVNRRTASSRFHPGASVSFGRRTKGSGCQVRGPLPDRACTPGARFRNATLRQVCRSGYTKTVRNVSEALKDRVYAEYGITAHSRSTYEVDHLVPLELGGSNSIANLFPEVATPRPGFHEKDRLENAAHDRVCSRARPLRATQRAIAKDWTKLYRQLFS